MSFAEYKFFSWARKGIAARIAEPDTLGKSDGSQPERAQVPIDITLNDTITVPTKNFTLIGPGDITGIQTDMIIRCEPRSGVSNFEPNYLPYVEFYDEDFPWRYTPASAAGTDKMSLRPWISLIVLKETEFEDTALQSPLKSIVVKNIAALQPLDELHLWAHTHTNLQNDETNFEKYIEQLKEQVKTDPDGIYSRVMCPRQLEPNIMYNAFLVPTFETGRLAGLGQSTIGVPAQKAAWKADMNEVELPVYYRWNFRTGANFDFESLVKLIEPRVMDKRVGVRPMDCSRPGYFQLNSSEEIPATDPVSVLLEGAVKAPTAESTTITPNAFQSSIAALVNLNRGQVEHSEDPYVTVPFYGMYHAMRKNIAQPGEKVIPVFDENSDVWYNDLNRDPRNRVPAGFGVKAVQDGQDRFMDQAWAQLSDVLEANRKARLAQLMSNIMDTSFNKNIATLDQEKILSITRSIASKIVSANLTIKKQINQSRVPEALFMPATQKIMRANSSVSRSLVKANITNVTIPAIIKDTNKTTGITAASIDKFKSLSELTAATTATPSAAISKLDIWSFQSNLDKTAFINSVKYSGGFQKIDLQATVVTPTTTVTPAVNPNLIINPNIITRPPLTPIRRPITPIVSSTLKVEPVKPAVVTAVIKPTMLLSAINANYKQAYTDYNVRFTYKETEAAKPLADIKALSSKTLETVKPSNAYKKMLGNIIIWGKGILKPPVDDILPAMAYPDFPAPTYKLLIDRDKELLLPNLDLIQPNTFSLLRTNQKFIESYMVGLNYEMGRELLWREYPTDMRGSYFRQFWDVKGIISPNSSSEDAEALKDIAPIHKWPNTNKLGANNARDKEGDSEQLVFVIRGDLLKKFPNTIIYAQKAFKDDKGKWYLNTALNDDDLAKQVRFPLYQAELPPDIKLLGFDLTINEAAGVDTVTDFPGNKEGWFFVVAEVPGEPRFGMDISYDPDKPNAVTWNDLSWENFKGEKIPFVSGNKAPAKPDGSAFNVADQNTAGTWGRSAADMATILLQRPVMIAIHATEMLDKEITGQKDGINIVTKLMKEYIDYRTNVLKRPV
ncbi:MAG: hypothetical protein QM640_10225 [Niabella sp.]